MKTSRILREKLYSFTLPWLIIIIAFIAVFIRNNVLYFLATAPVLVYLFFMSMFMLSDDTQNKFAWFSLVGTLLFIILFLIVFFGTMV